MALKRGEAERSNVGLLQSADPDPVIVEMRPDLRWLVVCDHASNRMPSPLGKLGLNSVELNEHIAWDIGAADAARRLAEQLNAPSIYCNYSRLVIDCNRYPSARDSSPDVSDGIYVPGNKNISNDALVLRRDEIFKPYHTAIANHLDAVAAKGYCPVFLSIHSCTRHMRGADRPWHIGLAWRRDDRFTRPVLGALRDLTDEPIGDNLPYDLELGGDFTTPEHAMTRGLAHLQVEFRNDLINTRDAAIYQADLLHRAIARVADDEDIMQRCWRHQHFLEPDDPVLFSFVDKKEVC